MKIILICPSNLIYMPYINNYLEILKEIPSIDYKILVWNRNNINELMVDYAYRDKKLGHQRTFFDYYKFNKYIHSVLGRGEYDKLIVFGIQIAFFLRKILIQKYNKRYIFDIRDKNKSINFFRIRRVIDRSLFTVVSSVAYKEWLPNCDKYVINHNTTFNNLQEVKPSFKKKLFGQINIAYIGALRDYQINIKLIDSLKNNERFMLNFHGEGLINKKIKAYIEKNCITNVQVTGRYEKDEENQLYNANHMINILRMNDCVNNRTALPNRLYYAAVIGIPLLAIKGTYVAEIVQHYKLGLVVESLHNLDVKVEHYFEKFDFISYDKSRKSFLESVIIDNKFFVDSVRNFLS